MFSPLIKNKCKKDWKTRQNIKETEMKSRKKENQATSKCEEKLTIEYLTLPNSFSLTVRHFSQL